MRNITFSADASLIQKARAASRARHTTLNAAFRRWLEQYVSQAGGSLGIDELMRRLQHVR